MVELSADMAIDSSAPELGRQSGELQQINVT